jgi:hypothetical protein
MSQWKFLFERDGKIWSARGSQEWVPERWYSVQGQLVLCRNGFHCSPGILAALGYIKGEVLAEVETDGSCLPGGDKSAHETMRIVRAWRWTQRDSVELAVFAAEKVLGIFESAVPGNDRPRKAIEAARAWLVNPNAYAAAYAAYNAACAAAYAAYNAAAYAAYNAARAACAAARAAYNAAGVAAGFAACDGAYAAGGAAYDAGGALRAEIESWLQGRLDGMEVIFGGAAPGAHVAGDRAEPGLH